MSYIVIFIAAVVLSVTSLGSVYLFDVDEAVFAQASKEMIKSGDWLNPTYNGVNRYDKPILIYWLMALSYKVFGVNEFAARFPSLLAAISLALSIVVFLSKDLSGDRVRFALICFLFSPYCFIYSRAAVTDMTLTLFIALSLFCFYSGMGLQNKLGFHIFSALAFLTKGLIGILFPFGIAISYIIVTKQWHRLRVVFSPMGLLSFLLVSTPWYIAQYQRNGMEFIEQFFLKHHFQRYTDVISGHQGPFYYYFIALFAGLLPWALLLPSAVRKGWQQRDSLYGFALLWLSFVVFFFSFSTTKLPNYILPSIPAAVILLSSVVEELKGLWFRLTLSLSSVLLIILASIAPNLLARHEITDVQWVYWIIPINLLTLVLIWLSNRRLNNDMMLGGLAFTMFLLLLLIALKALPFAGERLQGSLYRFSIYAKDNLAEGDRVFIYKINQPSILFYSDRRIVRAGSIREAEEILRDRSLRLAITRVKYKDEVAQMGFNLVERGQNYALFKRP